MAKTGYMNLTTGETLLYLGHTVEIAYHTEGVVWRHNALEFNSRIITAKFKTKKIKIKLNFIQCYPFTSNYRHSWIKQGRKI